MAITLVGGATSGTNNGGNPAVTVPVGVAQDDVIYASYVISSTADRAMSISTSGWTTEFAELYANDTFDANVAAYRKVQGSTPDSTVTFVGSGRALDAVSAGLYVLRGVDLTTSEDATPATATGINSAVPDPPPITTGTAAALVIVFAGTTVNDPAVTAPANYTDLLTENRGDTNSCTLYGAIRTITAPGAEDPGAFGSVTTTTDHSWGAFTIAVRPAVTNTTVSVDAGSYAVTGQAATLKRGYKIAADPGAYAVTGQAATLKYGFKVTAAPGSYAITGQAATLRATRKLAATAGSYTITGTDASLERGYKLSVDAGSYTVNGADAGLVYSGSGGKIIAADPGAYAVTGQAATLRIARNLAAAPGSYAITGQDVSLEYGFEVAAGAGSYLVTGEDATLKRGRLIAASSGFYTITGQAASLVHVRSIIAGAGSYLITGSDASVTTAGSVSFTLGISQGATLSPALSIGANMGGSVSIGARLSPRLEN